MTGFLCLILFAGQCLAKFRTCIIIKQRNDNGNPMNHSYLPIQTILTRSYPKLLACSDPLVDKTLFIKELIEDPGKLYLLTCPRLFGKSVNLDMLRTFLQIHVDEETNQREPLEQTENYKIFAENLVRDGNVTKNLLFPLLISNHAEFCQQHLGQHPIIRMNFFFGGVTFPALLYGFYNAVANAFVDHKYILNAYDQIILDEGNDNATKSDAYQRSLRFRFYVNGKANITISDVLHGIRFLSETIYQYFQKKVILLIDEYFVPIEMTFTSSSMKEQDKNIALNFYEHYMDVLLNGNPYLEKAILAGITTPPIELKKGAFRDVIECNMMSGKFMEFFGFNQWEIEGLYQYFSASDNMRREINHWYRSYCVNLRDVMIYNPWSVSQAFSTKKYDDFWYKTIPIKHWIERHLNVPTFKDRFMKLLENNQIPVKGINRCLTWQDYRLLLAGSTPKFSPKLDEAYADKAFIFLYDLGYLTLSRDTEIGMPVANYFLKIATREIGMALTKDFYLLFD